MDLLFLAASSNAAHACILSVAADPCLFPGAHLKDRVQPQVQDAEARASKRQRAPPVAGAVDHTFGTWLAAGAEWLTIGRYDDATLVYLPSQDAFYFASPAAMLSSRCPNRTVVLGQFVVEPGETPRVLVHDVVRLQGVDFVHMPPRERYACLQQLAPHLGPACTLQWAGECAVLAADLKSGKFKVPHPVRSVIALTGVPGKVVAVDG